MTNNFQQPIQNQTQYDRLPLPSKGIVYTPIDPSQPVDSVEVTYLTTFDEAIMTSQNLLASGTMPDELVKRKTKLNFNFDDLTEGDQLAILLWLRATMDSNYKLTLLDPIDNKPFTIMYDLSQIKVKEPVAMPDVNTKLFDFTLPKSKKVVRFCLLAMKHKQVIRNREQNAPKDGYNRYNIYRLETQIQSIDNITDKFDILSEIERMHLNDSRALLKYIDEVTPSMDLNVEVKAPSGAMVKTTLPLGLEFFFPSNT